MSKQEMQSYLRTKLTKSSSSKSKVKSTKRRNLLSEEERDCLWEEVQAKFDDMSETKRIAAFRRFWETDYEATMFDTTTNCFYRSAPLMRAFTICNDELARGYARFKGEKLSTQERVAVAVKTVKSSIKATIRRNKGVVRKNNDPLLQDTGFGERTWIFHGFREGFGSDDHLIGFFFSEASRNQAIEEVEREWRQYGVRTEPVHDERLIEDERKEYWRNNFDRKSFRRKFAKLSHEERWDAIEDLVSKGIELKYTDRETGNVYYTHDVFFLDDRIEYRFDKSKEFRYFTCPFALGYSEGNLPSPSKHFDEIDSVERTLLGILAKHRGYVLDITRTLPKDNLGSGCFNVHFPDEAARRSTSKEVFDTLSIYGVRFKVDQGEELSIDEQIAKAYEERDSARARLDSDWEYYKMQEKLCRKKDKVDRKFETFLAEEKWKLDQKEREFKEFERTIFERVNHLSRERVDCSDSDSMSEE